MRLWGKLRRIFTLERLIWCGTTVLTAAVFLTIGLTAPRVTGFGKENNTAQADITTTTVAAEETFTTAITTNAITTTTLLNNATTTSTTATSVSASSATEEISVKIPINTATKEQLMTVPGIGDAFSQRIINYRDSKGGFTDLTELMNIQGIGEKRYNQWKEYFTLD